ncbi:MAG TPA: DUF1365 domain-containing protein [Candidatus Hydrogenedentes bacterium]|nr:DUF1365 domain-containing protein [Candidatus Hydrogenedentota bacterium]
MIRQLQTRSALYSGVVGHRRFVPHPHAFRYRVFMLLLRLDELPMIFDRRWFWSARPDRPALAWFRREDHFGDPQRPLDEEVRQTVFKQAGFSPGGPILLLTHLRYWGYVMNPLSVFYCLSPDEKRLEAAVLEVHNTPWNERHIYVLHQPESVTPGGQYRYQFRKTFHVSPFMGMDYVYRCALLPPADDLLVYLENRRGGEQKDFDAVLTLKRRELTARTMAGALIRHPFMTQKVIAGIYWEAFRLWWKKTPYFPYSGKSSQR